MKTGRAFISMKLQSSDKEMNKLEQNFALWTEFLFFQILLFIKIKLRLWNSSCYLNSPFLFRINNYFLVWFNEKWSRRFILIALAYLMRKEKRSSSYCLQVKSIFPLLKNSRMFVYGLFWVFFFYVNISF